MQTAQNQNALQSNICFNLPKAVPIMYIQSKWHVHTWMQTAVWGQISGAAGKNFLRKKIWSYNSREREVDNGEWSNWLWVRAASLTKHGLVHGLEKSSTPSLIPSSDTFIRSKLVFAQVAFEGKTVDLQTCRLWMMKLLLSRTFAPESESSNDSYMELLLPEAKLSWNFLSC